MLSKRFTLAALALSALLPAAAAAQEGTAPAAAPAGLKGEMLQWFEDAEDKLVQLAEATPEAKYSYRPSKEVRTTGQVFMHVAAANFGIPTLAGVKPPEGFDFATYEKSLTKKADIHKALKDSFAHLEQALRDASDADLEKPVDLFGMKTTVRGSYVMLLSHAHEHLGQSIAYARGSGIVPPWTAKQQAAVKAAQEKKASAENK